MEKPSFRQALCVWARIAALSFGGPAGQIATMHRILVDEKSWISEQRFLHALNFCMVLPGPEAQQLATYIGWLLNGVPGGLAAGLLFIAPGAVAILGLSIIYALYGGVGFVAALFFGLKAAVLAIVAQALLRMARKSLKTPGLQAVAGLSFLALFLFGAPFPLVILAAGAFGYLVLRPDVEAGAPGLDLPPQSARASLIAGFACLILWLLPAALLLIFAPASVYADLSLFFSKMAVVTFGGAYAVLAYVAQQAVDGFHWLAPGEMLDGLGMAETTPGPLIMVLQFVGFLAAFRAPGALSPLWGALAGAALTTWATFTPCFAWIFLGAPYVERLRGDRRLAGALAAIGAAVVGVILNLTLWFALHTLFRQTQPVRAFPFALEAPVWASVDGAALALAIAALVATFRFKLSMGYVLAGAALLGAALYGLPIS